MSNINAVKLVLEHLELVEQAHNLICNELSKNIFKAVDKKIQESIENFEDDIIGIYDFTENEAWFLSRKWEKTTFDVKNSKTWNDMYAWYILINEGGVEGSENHFCLSNFFPNDIDRMAFYFKLYRNSFDKTSAKDWKEFVAKINQDYPQIEQLGFKFNPEGVWYLPIASLDKQAVIKHYENDTLEDALTPITEALEKVKQAHSYFDKIVQAAIAKFGRIEVEEAV